MRIQKITKSNEGYTHVNWVYRNVSSGFSRLYYIIDGEAYYEENGQKQRLKKHHLYLTSVKKTFSLYDNPDNQLLHTYAHVTTAPAVRDLIEVEIPRESPAADAIALWRKYVHSKDEELLSNVLQLLLACLGSINAPPNAVAEQTKRYLDGMNTFSMDMTELSRTLGYTREHLTRCFLAAYRTTPKQYLQARKMNCSMELLLSGRKVQEVAERLGYSSPYAFSKAFKAYFGLSPRQQLQLERTKTK